MKKILFSITLMVAILTISMVSFAGNRPRGHKAYVKHSKHHKAHKMHKPHGRIDATYQN